MPRGRKADVVRVQRAVLPVLAQHPDGLTINQLAKLAKLPQMTLRYHLDGSLAGFVEIHDVHVGDRRRPLLRIVRLKRGALSKHNVLLQKLLKEFE